ncbi:MAG: hypothetical protein KGL39_52860 [Patescibacteria group bacterium]|nr:hypothetical protein [Patescibacteria group bacterium]
MAKKICGVNIRKADTAVLSEELEKLGLDSSGSIPIKIERMASFIREKFCGSADLKVFNSWLDSNSMTPVVCDPGCGGISHADLFDRCPFCGDEEEIDMDQVVEAKEIEVLTSETLDENVARIKVLKESMVDGYYELGQALAENETKGLWKLRTNGGGAPKYRTFADWSRAETGLGRTQVWKCISVAKNFTAEQVREIGHTKLAIALQVPSQNRAELLEKAKAGASKRELEQVAAEIKENDKPEVTVEPVERRMTVAVAPASVELELTGFDGDPAASIESLPAVAFEMLPNGVAQKYTVFENEDGYLMLKVERVREG